MLYMPIAYVLIPENFLMPGSAVQEFPGLLCSVHLSAANSGLLCSVHLKVLQIPGLFVLCAPKSVAISRRSERGTSLGKKTGDPLRSHYVGKFQKIFLCNFRATVT